MPWLCQPCNVSCCIWKELSEYTNEEYENEEICIVNCRFFVCFILFVLTMFSLLFFTCTHSMFSLRVFYIFSIFVGINIKKLWTVYALYHFFSYYSSCTTYSLNHFEFLSFTYHVLRSIISCYTLFCFTFFL